MMHKKPPITGRLFFFMRLARTRRTDAHQCAVEWRLMLRCEREMNRDPTEATGPFGKISLSTTKLRWSKTMTPCFGDVAK